MNKKQVIILWIIAAALGRGTVPVLRIEGDDGEVEWLPESAEIVRYLEAHFGRS